MAREFGGIRNLKAPRAKERGPGGSRDRLRTARSPVYDPHITGGLSVIRTPFRFPPAGRASLLALPFLLLACEAPEVDEGPELTDLPVPALEALSASEPIPQDILPRDAPVRGVGVSARGETLVLAVEEDGVEGARFHSYYWSDEEGRWYDPVDIDFVDPDQGDAHPMLSYDQNLILFSSFRNPDQPGAADYNIWLAPRQGAVPGAEVVTHATFEAPRLLPAIHSPAYDGAPAMAADGSLFFASERDGEGRNIWFSEYADQNWGTPSRLGDEVNSAASDTEPFVPADRSYIVFASDRDGPWNLYLSREVNGVWSEAEPLEALNTEADERSPALSFAGHVLFFVRDGEVFAVDAGEAGLPRGDEDADSSPAG